MLARNKDEAGDADGDPSPHGHSFRAVDAETVLESVTDGFVALDRDERITYVNAAAERALLRPRGELLGRNAWAEFPAFAGAALRQACRRSMVEQARATIKDYYPPTGRWFEARIYPAQDGGVAIYFRDITKRSEAERQIRESEARFRSIFEQAAIGIKQVALDGRLIEANDTLCAMLGYCRDELQGLTTVDITHPDDRAADAAMVARVLAGEIPSYAIEKRHLRKDGAPLWVRVTSSPALLDGRPLYFISVVEDITERKRAEADLRRLNERLEGYAAERARELAASEARYAAFFELTTVGVVMVKVSPDAADPRRRFVYEAANPAHLRRGGIAEEAFVGKTPHGVFPPDLADRLVERYASCADEGATIAVEDRFPFPTGEQAQQVTLVPIRDPTAEGGRVTRILISIHDVTEQKRAEEQLRAAQKMQAIGQLAAGAAHDFNNLLTGVIGNLDLLAARETNARKLRLVEGAVRAAERGAELTQRLLAFSRRQRLERQAVDLNDLVARTGNLLTRTLGGTVEVRFAFADDLWPALADVNQVELAVLNLAINARDAMPEGGTLTIATRNAALHRADGDLEAGDYVVLSVADTGIGMSEEVRARAFEPFYTTKEVGKGTGLGLSQIYGVAQQLGGTARLRSAPGAGTTVEVYLPRSLETHEPAEAKGAEQTGAQPAAPKARATLLLVDDDLDAREVVVEGLREAGYEVLEADGGERALALLRSGRPIDLLVTDYAMPGLNGAALAAEARALRGPGLKTLYVTGYADTSSLALGPGDTLLAKPFRVADLVPRIEAALGT